MMDIVKRDQNSSKNSRGLLQIDIDECKGCGLCIEACPPKVISMSEALNHYGYRTAVYAGAGCTACGICFMACPEPGAITVLRAVMRKETETHAVIDSLEVAAPCASN
jgi:2-oxoglutarate ferredoxin oxidoreductase subunit delta